MTYLLFTIYLTTGCHADGPMIRYDVAGEPRSECNRDIVWYETVPGFRSLEACEREARARWNDTRWRTASRCQEMK